MKSFIDIFDIEKLKETTNYIITGEKYKFEKTLHIIKDKYQSELDDKDKMLTRFS